MRRSRFFVGGCFALLLISGSVGALPAAYGAAITPTVFTDDNTVNGNCTLREAVRAANGDIAVDACPPGSGPDEIRLIPGTYLLSLGPAGDDAAMNGDLDVTEDLTLTGAGSAATIVEGGGVDRVLHVNPAGPSLTFAMRDLTVRGGDAGGGDGGGLTTETDTSATIEDAVFTANVTDSEGGGIQNQGAMLLDRVTLSENRAQSDSGAIENFQGELTIRNSTLTRNTSTGSDAGAIENYVTLTIVNSTISGNTSESTGGAIYNFGGGTLTITSSTISGNQSQTGAGAIYRGTGTVSLSSSIVANNTGPEGNCEGTVTSAGYNLSDDATCGLTQPTDKPSTDPQLGPLADNGGLTQTHALLKGSPAIDAGGAGCEATDQRGLGRSDCDIGAYERVLCAKVPVNRIGTEGKDKLGGTNGPDGMLGLGGKDTLNGKGGKDGLCGGGGKDKLKGGGGKDRLKGQGGKDTCIGGGGKDKATCERERKVP